MPDAVPEAAPLASGTSTSHERGKQRTLTAGDRRRGVGSRERRLFKRLQAIEDAIAYRRLRTAIPCPDCGPAPGRCDDHDRDLELITGYFQTHHQVAGQLRVLRRQHLTMSQSALEAVR